VPLIQCLDCGKLERNPVRGRCHDCHRKRRVASGYDSQEWGRCAKAFLTAHPFCDCGAPAKVAHHKFQGMRPTSRGGLDWRNLEAKCHTCHNRIAQSYRL